MSTGRHRLFLNVSVPWIPLTPPSGIFSLHLTISSFPPPQFCGPQASPMLILWQLTHGYTVPPPGLWSVFSALFLSARNRYLFWKDLGLSALNLVTLKVDKVPLLLKVLSRLPLEKVHPRPPGRPLQLCPLSLVSLPGQYLTLLCPPASHVSDTHDTVPPKHPTLPSPLSSNLYRDFPLPPPCLGDSCLQQPSSSTFFYIKPSWVSEARAEELPSEAPEQTLITVYHTALFDWVFSKFIQQILLQGELLLLIAHIKNRHSTKCQKRASTNLINNSQIYILVNLDFIFLPFLGF